MLDRSGTPWVLRIPAAITKNRTGRTLGLEGEVRAIIEARVRVRRFDCPLIFHRECKGKPGQPITDFWDVWRNALQAAGLPAGRLFHDLRRSAVRTLIRAGVDETTAMKVSGHKTRSMLLRYDIVTERETADALLRADSYLSTQPTSAESEKGQLRDIRKDGGGKSLTRQRGVGSSGRIRTEKSRPLPEGGVRRPRSLGPVPPRPPARSLADPLPLVVVVVPLPARSLAPAESFGSLAGLPLLLLAVMLLYPLGVRLASEGRTGTGSLFNGYFLGAWSGLPVPRETIIGAVYAHGLLGAGALWVRLLAYTRGESPELLVCALTGVFLGPAVMVCGRR